MPKHNCFPPLRTGREDFPHPALTQTLAAQQYVDRNRLSSAAQPRSKMRTVPQPCGWGSVGGLSSKRNSHPLTQRVCVPAPSLHGRYPLRSYYEPVRLPTEPPQGYAFPSGVGPLPQATPPGLPGSSTDLSPRAVPNHPGEPGGCSRPLLHHRWQASSRMAAWPLSIHITRPNRVRLRYGSWVRFARLRVTDHSIPRGLRYLLNGQLQGKLLSAYKISQTFPGTPYIVVYVCARPLASPVAQASSCMSAPRFWYGQWNTLRVGDMGKQCRPHICSTRR